MDKRIQEIVSTEFKRLVGTVNVNEFDWKIQIASAYARFEEYGEIFQLIDVGKLVGIAKYVCELEQKLSGNRRKIPTKANK